MYQLTAKNITKDYPGCRALDNVSVAFESGRIHAIVGKNGSGKSTLLKIFAGAEKQTAGEFSLGDKVLDFNSPREAMENGIVMVYQELSLVPSMTVAENIYLGRLPKIGKSRYIDWKKAYQMANELLADLKIDIDPKAQVYKLSLWQRQVVEIAKAMSHDPKILILDEPTSSLAQAETQMLMRLIRELKKKGIIILYISHRLQELWEIADTVTVIRDGQYIGTREMAEMDHQGILKMMFGDTEIRKRPDDIVAKEDVVLSVRNLTRDQKFENVSFDLHAGEVLGIAGMVGAGRTELLRCIFGADKFDSGEIYIEGEQITGVLSPQKMRNHGVGMAPEERKLQGSVQIHSIRDNLCYASLSTICPNHFLNSKMRKEFANRQIENLQIKISDPMRPIRSLSGGNQQKVVVGNWLNTDPKIMLYDEPSRGIDVVAKQQIFEIIWNQARKGMSSIVVSSELEELLEVCQRVLIMYHGKIFGEIDTGSVTVEELYSYCMGGKINE